MDANVIVGFLIGIIVTGILYSVYESDSGWKIKYKIRKLTPKVGDMYATYPNYYVEHWMLEDYTELFIVKYVGKKYVRLESIEDKRGTSNSNVGKVTDVEILALKMRYQKYLGNKNKKTMYDDLLDNQ